MSLRAHAALVLLLAACSGDDTGEPAAAGNQGPTLDHTAPPAGAVDGDVLYIDISATDPDGVESVTLYWRRDGDAFWESHQLVAGEGDDWAGEIGPVSSPGIDYYFEAVDASVSRAYSRFPAEGERGALTYEVADAALTMPWIEDFERPEGPVSLFRMDWWTPSEGLDVFAWFASTSQANSGDVSAFHTRVPEGDRAGLVDWLVSPPLNLSTLDQPTVVWQEYGSSTGGMAGHQLAISTGSPVPEAGDYEVVAALPAPPNDAWGRSAIYDLSSWSNAEVAYLAWVYTAGGDDWFIDDVEVTPLKADPTASLTWEPAELEPGGEAQVTALFTNQTAAPASGLEATLSFPSGGATIETNPLPVDLPGNDSTAVTWEVTLDPDVCDNCYIPMRVSLSDPSDSALSWTFDGQMLIGELSIATLALPAGIPVDVKLGKGTPDDPSILLDWFTGVTLTSTLELDITDYNSELPPGPGAERWFVTIDASTEGAVGGFSMSGDGFSQSATVLPALSADTVVWLPEPPAPAVSTVAPSSTSPGSVDVPLTINLRNDGAATVGPVTGSLAAVSPNISVSNATGLTVTDDVWAATATTSVTGPLLTVGADHNQSQPALLDFTMTDGADTWVERVAVPVPWPYLVVAGTEIDDSGGDGLLDNGETATLTFDIANTGDLDTFDRLSATLSVATSSTATATITSGTGSLFSIASGGTRDEDFSLEVTSGSTGDTLDLELLLDDGTTTYTVPIPLQLGVQPWQALTPFDDDIGDALGSYPFDLQRAEYRVTGTQVELRLTSATEYDPDTVFLEAWGSSSGSVWDYYRWVVQPGSAGLYGLDASGVFTELSALNVDTSSPTQVVLTFDTTDMDLIIDRFRIGLAAGWCGPDTYFCDHFPNGWGWPYVSFDSGDWYEVSW